MKIPNDIYPIEQDFIKSSFSYYKNLKFVIKQADIVNKEIFLREGKDYNGIFSLEAVISKKRSFAMQI
jgi:hypothetical protein